MVFVSGVGTFAIFGNVMNFTTHWGHNRPTPASAGAIACALGLGVFSFLRRVDSRFSIDPYMSAPFEQPMYVFTDTHSYIHTC